MRICYVLRNKIQYALYYVHIKLELPVLPAPPTFSEELPVSFSLKVASPAEGFVELQIKN